MLSRLYSAIVLFSVLSSPRTWGPICIWHAFWEIWAVFCARELYMMLVYANDYLTFETKVWNLFLLLKENILSLFTRFVTLRKVETVLLSATKILINLLSRKWISIAANKITKVSQSALSWYGIQLYDKKNLTWVQKSPEKAGRNFSH